MIKKVIAGIQKITFYGAVDVALSFPGGLCCTGGFMDNQSTWTDETEANYRKWHKERYGVEPPEVKLPMKEESMKKDKIPEGFHEHAIGIHEDHKDPEPSGGVAEMRKLYEAPPSMEEKASFTISGDGALSGFSQSKRTRRPKGLSDNVTVETYLEATVHVYVPARPEGMKKVTIAIHYHHDTAPLLIDWPEGKSAIEALTEKPVYITFH